MKEKVIPEPLPSFRNQLMLSNYGIQTFKSINKLPETKAIIPLVQRSFGSSRNTKELLVYRPLT